MAADQPDFTGNAKQIVIKKNGSYVITGDVPLVRKTQVVSEHGEPLTWEKCGEIPTSPGEYHLCRCGQSGEFPFCDGTHRKVGFDGTETAQLEASGSQKYKLPGGIRITVRKDSSLCMQSGFCGFSGASLSQLMASTNDTKVRSLVMAMVERCPSGSLTYSIEPGGPEIEPDLPQQVALTTEITSSGPIAGPIWVTGEIQVLLSNGQALGTRNRVTLCNCGQSSNKPLCDGTHRMLAERKEKQRQISGS